MNHWIAEAKLKGDDYGLSTKVTVSWSSTSRDIALAYVALENYRHALDFAIKIEAFINGRPIIIAKQPDVKDGD